MLVGLGLEAAVERGQDVGLQPLRLGRDQVLLVVTRRLAVAEGGGGRAQRVRAGGEEDVGGLVVEPGIAAGRRGVVERSGQAVEAAVEHAELGREERRHLRVGVAVPGGEDVVALGNELGEARVIAAEVHHQGVYALRRAWRPPVENGVELTELRREGIRADLVARDPPPAQVLGAVVGAQNAALVSAARCHRALRSALSRRRCRPPTSSRTGCRETRRRRAGGPPRSSTCARCGGSGSCPA